MSDHGHKPDETGDWERWRALRAALDRGDGEGAAEIDVGVDPSNARRLDIEVDREQRRGDAGSTELGAPSDRVLTVDLDEDRDFESRGRHGPVGPGETDDD